MPRKYSIRRTLKARAGGPLGTALASYAVLVSDFHLAFEDFLILTYLWAPAWAAVVLLTFFYFFESQPKPRLALVAWLAGTSTSLLFVNYLNLFSNVSAAPTFNHGLVSALHGADLSGLVSVAVAAAVYWTGRRVRFV